MAKITEEIINFIGQAVVTIALLWALGTAIVWAIGSLGLFGHTNPGAAITGLGDWRVLGALAFIAFVGWLGLTFRR